MNFLGEGEEQTFRISGVTVFGPFDENEAINGAGFVPNCVLTRVRYTMGFLWIGRISKIEL